MKLDKLHTPSLLRDIIVNLVDKYYNNGLIDDLSEFTNTPFNHNKIMRLPISSVLVEGIIV